MLAYITDGKVNEGYPYLKEKDIEGDGVILIFSDTIS